ncbi:MAG: diguanylate cyclase domain-containing protein [Bacillota bacterium]
MFEWIRQALEKTGIGIIITDASQRIVFWNNEMEKLSQVSRQDAMYRRLSDVCPKFGEPRYQGILDNVISAGQSRFCSSMLHKAFVFPENKTHEIRQNMKAEPILVGDEVGFAFLQISDVTEQVRNEHRLKEHINELKQGYQKIKESEEAAMRMARYDALTGILNRRAFESELETAIEELKGSGKGFVLLFLDLDGFKYVNDTFGHLVGDVLLQQVAGRLRSNTRHDGRRPTDIVARIGGDEFVVALMGMRSEKDAVIVANKINNIIRKTFFIDNNRINISASIGVAVYPDDADSVKALIHAADKAMYGIKQSGKDGMSFYNTANIY